MAFSIQVPGIDSLISSVMPYTVPALIILLVLGCVFLVLRNLKAIILLALIALLLMYLGVIPKVNISAPFVVAQNETNSFAIANLAIGKTTDGGMVVDNRIFKTSDPEMYVGFGHAGGQLGSELLVRVKHAQSNKYMEKSTVLLEQEAYSKFLFQKPTGGWEIGEYLVSIYSGNTLITEAVVQVVQ